MTRRLDWPALGSPRTNRAAHRFLILPGLLLIVVSGLTVAASAQEPTAVDDSFARKDLSRSMRQGREPVRSSALDAPGSTGWWFGSAGIALVLAVCGGVCVAARKYLPPSTSPRLKVVGRVSLSAKHSIHLLRADGRILLIGTGPQGAPSYLGDLDELPSETQDLDKVPAPRSHATPMDGSSRAEVPAKRLRLDVRVGDDA
jgi:hypothetical protein